MNFMTIKEASEKWDISESRIRQLIQDGRILGAKKIGAAWYIPNDAGKPIDKRVKEEIEFKIDLPEDYFKEVDEKLTKLNSKRPLSKEATESLQNAINLEWTYNSNGIEGNTLTLKETKVVLEGITIGGKSVRESSEYPLISNSLASTVRRTADMCRFLIPCSEAIFRHVLIASPAFGIS